MCTDFGACSGERTLIALRAMMSQCDQNSATMAVDMAAIRQSRSLAPHSSGFRGDGFLRSRVFAALGRSPALMSTFRVCRARGSFHG